MPDYPGVFQWAVTASRLPAHGVATVVFPSVKLAMRHPEGAMSNAIDNFRQAIVLKARFKRSLIQRHSLRQRSFTEKTVLKGTALA